MKLDRDKIWFLIFVSWLIVMTSILGSLFFSDVMKLPPCVLCWYQRICMYPLAILLGVALFPLDKNVLKFAFPLSGIGLLISVYHNLLYYKILPESTSPCVQGISCTTVQIEWFGFITIPFLSLVSFFFINIIFALIKVSHEE